MYANGKAFDDPTSRMGALGYDVSETTAVVDLKGKVLFYARAGGMLNPERVVIERHAAIFRFGGGSRAPEIVAKGNWWIEAHEFEKLMNFANEHRIAVGVAMRLLCLVPPEWNDATLLIRARVRDSLLAWRGLGNSVVTKMEKSSRMVRMPHQNDIASRRFHQLFVPGLHKLNPVDPALAIESVYALDKKEGKLGFLYL